MKRTTITAILFVLSTFIGTASADHRSVVDRNDARGLLDVKRVTHSGETYAKWRIDTYDRWYRRAILDQGFVTIYLDTHGGDRHDYYALVWADKNRVRGTLMRDRAKTRDVAISGIPIGRENSRSVTVTVNLKKLRIASDRATYNWYVQTMWSSSGCRRVCFDWAPNVGSSGGGIEEPLPLSL